MLAMVGQSVNIHSASIDTALTVRAHAPKVQAVIHEQMRKSALLSILLRCSLLSLSQLKTPINSIISALRMA